MTLVTVLRWNDDWRPGVIGYTITKTGSGPVVVPSACFYDAGPYADQAAADAIAYGVSAAVDTGLGGPFDVADAATLTVRRYTFDAAVADFCVVSGSVLPVSGMTEQRSDLRFEVAALDRPELYATAGLLGVGTFALKTDAYGRFSAVLLRGAPVLMHVPSAAVAVRFVTPAAASANLQDLALETYDLHRNN